jgi:hypothetical protein
MCQSDYLLWAHAEGLVRWQNKPKASQIQAKVISIPQTFSCHKTFYLPASSNTHSITSTLNTIWKTVSPIKTIYQLKNIVILILSRPILLLKSPWLKQVQWPDDKLQLTQCFLLHLSDVSSSDTSTDTSSESPIDLNGNEAHWLLGISW